MEYADLHIHTKNNSNNKDGETIENILKQALKNKTHTISFTSHDSLEQYYELYNTIKEIKKNDIELYNRITKNIKIVIGFEINCLVEENRARDMLVFNVPIEKIKQVQKWLNENTNKDISYACQFAQLKHLKTTADRLNISYEKDKMISSESPFAGMVFANAVKNSIDEMLVDVLLKENSISSIFERAITEDEKAEQILSETKDKKDAYKKIINDADIIEENETVALIKRFYYQIIDLRLFANQRTSENTMKTVDEQVKDIIKIMKEQYKNKNDNQLDEEALNLINAELYSKIFNTDNKELNANPYVSVLHKEDMKKSKDYNGIQLALYYSIANEIDKYIKGDRQTKRELSGIQTALVKSGISFADILERQNWFNSQLIRSDITPFYFNTTIFKPKLEDVIKKMHSVGAIVEVAHPYVLDAGNVEEYMNTCYEKGVDGIESLYVFNRNLEESKQERKIVQEFCREKGLIYMHGGTDFHDPKTDEVGLLRNGERIKQEDITNEMKAVNVEEFMRQMDHCIEQEEER